MIQGMALSRERWEASQATARTVIHGCVAGGRSRSGESSDATLGTSRGDCDIGEEVHHAEDASEDLEEDLGASDSAAVITQMFIKSSRCSLSVAGGLGVLTSIHSYSKRIPTAMDGAVGSHT